MTACCRLPALLILAAVGLMPESAARAADMPDPRLTPGVVASSDTAEECESDGRPSSAYSRAHREMNEAQRRADFARYGIPWSDHRLYEDDHLTPYAVGRIPFADSDSHQRSGEEIVFDPEHKCINGIFCGSLKTDTRNRK